MSNPLSPSSSPASEPEHDYYTTCPVEIHTKIALPSDTSADTIFRVLLDGAKTGQWNPFIKHANFDFDKTKVGV